MKHSILIIDDEKVGAENLQRFFQKGRPNTNCFIAFEEDQIKKSISDLFFDVAIVDLRMDNFSIDGFSIIKDIIEINPFAKIIIISAYINEYQEDLNEVLKTGKIAAIVSKDKFQNFSEKLDNKIQSIFDEFENNLDFNQQNLRNFYLEVKNEKDKYEKGIKLERFTSYLFGLMGFVDIQKRVIDKSRNEIDLIVRNEINDFFFSKFSPYFFIECKNTIEKIDKNIFIIFREKLSGSNGMSKLGFIITPSGFKRTAYLEALRTSHNEHKIIFLSNSEIELLIDSVKPLNVLKSIIDKQTKDN